MAIMTAELVRTGNRQSSTSTALTTDSHATAPESLSDSAELSTHTSHVNGTPPNNVVRRSRFPNARVPAKASPAFPVPLAFVPNEEGGPLPEHFNRMVVVQAFANEVHPDQCISVDLNRRADMYLQMREIVSHYGEVIFFDQIDTHLPSNGTTAYFIMESVEAAAQVVQDHAGLEGNAIPGKGCMIIMLPASPCLELARRRTMVTVLRLPEGTSQGDHSIQMYERAFIRRMMPAGRGLAVIEEESRLPLDQVPLDQIIEYCDNMGINLPTGNISRGDRNIIVRDRIGTTDVRTTVMLRNIPNNIQVRHLIKLLNDIMPGSFDFVYLRIDFNNGCNVGYGFINFVAPDFIKQFLYIVAYKRWANSNKRAEIRYATVQGVEALVNKFRNSAVMAQDASARPMLFNAFGVPAPMIGYPRLFPTANNLAKYNQSIQNREIIGLYSPRRAHHGGLSPTRLRRGHYDRGNTYDLREQNGIMSSYGSPPLMSPGLPFGH